MKFGVIVFPGSNCDHDAYHVVSKHVGQPVDFIWHKETDLSAFDAVIVPGGFSYGDYLRAGALARFSPVMNAVKKYVASRTLNQSDLTWNNSTLLSAEDAISDVASLRQQQGRDIVMWGSLSLVRALLAQGLVDELNLMIEPILLGRGKSVFPDDGAARPLELVRAVTASTGVLVCTYRPA